MLPVSGGFHAPALMEPAGVALAQVLKAIDVKKPLVSGGVIRTSMEQIHASQTHSEAAGAAGGPREVGADDDHSDEGRKGNRVPPDVRGGGLGSSWVPS